MNNQRFVFFEGGVRGREESDEICFFSLEALGLPKVRLDSQFKVELDDECRDIRKPHSFTKSGETASAIP